MHFGRTLNRGEKTSDDPFGASPYSVHRMPLGLLHNPNRSKIRISGALFRRRPPMAGPGSRDAPQWLSVPSVADS